MRRIPTTSLLTALVVAALLGGCGTSGVGDILGGGRDTSTSNDRYRTIDDVRGTVERVDTLNQRIYVDGEAGYRNDLRNGDDEIVLYYDDRTVVEYEGRTYRPQDLERGDRIQAEVDQSGDRLIAEEIEVLYDATRAGTGGSLDDDDLASNELRGTVRSVDTRDRTVEIERSSGYRSGRDNIVVVHYDSRTIVEFEGRRYNPENLERGDRVEVELSNRGGRLLAEEILVVDDVDSR